MEIIAARVGGDQPGCAAFHRSNSTTGIPDYFPNQKTTTNQKQTMNEEHPEQKPASTPPPLNPPPPPFAAVPPSLNPTQYVPIPKNPNIRDLFEILLRRPTQLAGHQVCEEMPTLLRFGMIALLSILVFGFVLGTFAYHDQLWAAPLKMGGGMLFAGIICFPSLYIFSQPSHSMSAVLSKP